MDPLGWEALIGDGEWRHAYAAVLGVPPEAAVERAMERARGKYGDQDWTRWRMRAEPIPPGSGDVRHFKWDRGELR